MIRGPRRFSTIDRSWDNICNGRMEWSGRKLDGKETKGARKLGKLKGGRRSDLP